MVKDINESKSLTTGHNSLTRLRGKSTLWLLGRTLHIKDNRVIFNLLFDGFNYIIFYGDLSMSVLVGRPAPDFTASAVLGSGEIVDEFNLSTSTKGKYAVVFFYPLDFTFVCPSELIAFDHRLKEFTARGVEVIGVSIDSHFSHNA